MAKEMGTTEAGTNSINDITPVLNKETGRTTPTGPWRSATPNADAKQTDKLRADIVTHHRRRPRRGRQHRRHQPPTPTAPSTPSKAGTTSASSATATTATPSRSPTPPTPTPPPTRSPSTPRRLDRHPRLHHLTHTNTTPGPTPPGSALCATPPAALRQPARVAHPADASRRGTPPPAGRSPTTRTAHRRGQPTDASNSLGGQSTGRGTPAGCRAGPAVWKRRSPGSLVVVGPASPGTRRRPAAAASASRSGHSRPGWALRAGARSRPPRPGAAPRRTPANQQPPRAASAGGLGCLGQAEHADVEGPQTPPRAAAGRRAGRDGSSDTSSPDDGTSLRV